MAKYKLNTLPQELVNQIAAGEVIERPASVVKELVDNSIDANSTKIHIKVENGGIDLIEVSDNGSGIPQENISDIFTAHTTSKISNFEDLNSLLTMGFRGEALSTIVSIAQVSMTSKYINSDFGSEILFKNFNDFTIKKAARESGTVISVKNIFENIPARRKFLKTSVTEYRKILEILYPYFLIYPNIHFTLEKDGKRTINLKQITNSKPNTLEKSRVEEILKEDFVKRMLKLFYNGSGMKVGGLIAHPSDHQKRSNNQYIFVNGRSIWDNGIARAVIQGYERYIPFGQRVPFILLIDIQPSLIDINVHPRKEEIRFLNPFRVYSGIEEAVKKSLISSTTYHIKNDNYNIKSEEQSSFVNVDMNRKIYSSKDITFDSNQKNSVKESLLFSKEALGNFEYTKSSSQEENSKEPKPIRNIFQIFNKYIVIEFNTDILWVVDQHAAAERITFEKLIDTNQKERDIQNLLVPISIEYSEKDLHLLEQLREFFLELGFKYNIENHSLNISSVPVEFVSADFKIFFDKIFQLDESKGGILKNINKLREDLLATMSCHTSVRSGQSLHKEEMLDIYKKLIVCKNPYSCPHGRPAVWKLKISEIDSNFERTY